MKQLIEYLKEKKIKFKEIDDSWVSINGDNYLLVKPNEDGVVFTEDFHIMADPRYCDKCVYFFGGKWYWENKEDFASPKLNELLYVGKSTSKIKTNSFLGIRSCYEIMNGSRLYSDWTKKAKFLGVKYLGICEKNTLSGVLKFQLACDKNDIIPIVGATYTVFRESSDYRYDVKCYVKNQKGWENLLLINREVKCNNNGFIKEEDLFKFKEGLYFVVDPKSMDFESLFPLDLSMDVFYQLDTVEYVKNDIDKDYLLNLKKYVRSDLKPISITDAFYLEKEDSNAKIILNNIAEKREVVSKNQYFKDKEDYFNELEQLFNVEDDSVFDIFKEALNNEKKLVDGCNFRIETDKKHLPKYVMTDEEAKKYEDSDDMFWSLVEDGLKKKANKKEISKYIAQIEKEYDIIDYGQLQDYFLINWEQIKWCEKSNIMTGVARGSSAGFQTSNLLNITKIDPFDYDLIAERFLTKERAKHSIADIDCDVEQQRRDDIKKHLMDKYGYEQCCSVGTYTTFQIKGGLKDIAKIEGIPFAETNYITSILEKECKEWPDIFKIAAKKKRLKNFIKEYPYIINDLKIILNSKKATSMHASAFIITPKEKTVYEWMPVRKEIKDGEEILVSEWEGGELEAAGFLKQDLLGLLQLDKFHYILDLIKQNKGADIDIYNLPLDCKKTYSYFKKGWTQDVFQFGTKELSKYCKELDPEDINDLIAANALYRPGSIHNNFHNEYIIRKNDEKKVEYYTGTEDITKNTYGILCYQEQIMQICQKLAGFDLSETDVIRKALGKKKADLIKLYGDKFVERSVKNGYEEKEMIKLWNAMEKFSSYSFNLSHAAAYSIMGYISQWLKVHYPIEFWTAAFKFANDKKVSYYISEINKSGDIKIMASDINKSKDDVYTDFQNLTICWPFSSIKQCGEKASKQIMEERDKNGEYFSFEEFLARHTFKSSKVTKQVIENLVLSGAFDEIEQINRHIDRIKLIDFFRKENKVKVDTAKDLLTLNVDKLSEDWWWNLQQKRVSGISFFNYGKICKDFMNESDIFTPSDEIQIESFATNRQNVCVGGYVTEIIERDSKKGKWVRIEIESNYDFCSITMWAEQYRKFEKLDIKSKEKCLLFLTGEVVFDSFKKENIVQATDKTKIIILE
jgi:DNA polymerase-3 subunit alpha